MKSNFNNLVKSRHSRENGNPDVIPRIKSGAGSAKAGNQYLLNNQRGVALVIALIMLIVLTLIGLSSIGTSIFETKISGNERFSSSAFYAAEGGLEDGINRIPDLTAYSGNIGPDVTYRSGRITDSSAQPSKNLGLALKPGYDPTWEFKRFQVCATGESFGARKEIEVQILLGPYPAGTSYNN
jgi:hypothetical protein